MEESKKEESIAVPAWVPLTDWTDFLDHRRKTGKITDRAKELLLKDLEKLKAEGNDPALVLQQSIKRGWKGLFAIKDDRQSPSNNLKTQVKELMENGW